MESEAESLPPSELELQLDPELKLSVVSVLCAVEGTLGPTYKDSCAADCLVSQSGQNHAPSEICFKAGLQHFGLQPRVCE